MKGHTLFIVSLLAACPTVLLAQPLMDTNFTFQGQLKHRGAPVDGQADLVFRLFDAQAGGNQIGTQIGRSFVEVVGGLFTVELDFGAAPFDGEDRWLEVEVEYPSGEGNWTTLKPRQRLTAAPYAIHTRGLHVDEVGEVGVGTTSPQAPLHVFGDGSRTVRVRNSAATGGTAIAAEATAGSGFAVALDAYTSSPTGSTIYAFNEAESGNGYALQAETKSPNGIAVYGHATNGSERSTGIGVYGSSDSDDNGTGVLGEATSPSGTTYGVRGVSSAGSGVRGTHAPTGNYGSLGTSTAGVYGRTARGASYAVRGHTSNADGYAGYFTGGRNYFEGNVGIGEVEPTSPLHIAGAGGGEVRLDANGTDGGTIRLLDATGNAGVVLQADHASSIAGEVSLYNDAGSETVELLAAEGADNGGQITIRKADGTVTIQMDAEFGTDGGASVELIGGAAGPALFVQGTGAGRSDATLRVNNAESIQGMAAYLTNSSTFATAHVQNDGPGETLWLESNGGGEIIVARTPARRQFWVDGVGTTHARTLQVHDNVTYSTDRTFYLNVPACSFREQDPTDDDVYAASTGYGWIADGVAPFDANLCAPIHLPQGATVVRMHVYYQDDRAAEDIDVSAGLVGRGIDNLSGYNIISMSFSSAGAASGIQSQSDTPLSPATIDNTDTQYALSVWWTQDDLVPFLRFYGCRIEYTISTLNP